MVARLLFITNLLILSVAYSATYNSVANGIWEVDGTWNTSPGADNDCTPSGNNTFNVNHYVTSNCALLDFSGTVTIHVSSGATFYLSGSGGITGNVNLVVDNGATVIVLGNFDLGGSSTFNNNGTVQIYGNVTGSSTFDCNGSGNTGTVQIGGTGCSKCTAASASACAQNVPLPVNLADFSGSSTQNSIIVEWTTSYEKDNAWFELERSTDAVSYSVINRRPGQSYFESMTDYSFVDTEVMEGITYYYRLVQIDSDGSKTRTDAISVSFGEAQASILISPNPTTESDMKISMQHMAQEDVLLVLYDINGNIVYSKVEHLASDNEVFSANDLHVDLLPGIYMVAASNKNQLVKKKLIIY